MLALAGCTGNVAIDLPDATTSTGGDDGAEHVEGVPDTGDTDTKTDTEPNPEEVEATYQAFYAFGEIQEVRLFLSEEAMDAMEQDVREARRGSDLVMHWQAGDVEINGEHFANVAVRIKGSSTLDDLDGKPSLKIKLNEFVQGQKYGGLERITLNKDMEDPAQAKQVLVYKINLEAGRPTVRANHALVYVNDEPYGLYTNVETYDDHWLERWYTDPTGDLWEGNDYADFTRQGVQYWELASGVGDTSALETVADRLRADGDFVTRMDEVVDMDDFVHFWAWRVMVGDVDGYPATQNDVYVYGDPADGGRFDFLPWGVDESWYDDGPAYWYYATGELGAACIADEGCLTVYKAALTEVVDQYEGMDVLGWADAVFAATESAVQDDPRRYYSFEDAQAERAELRSELEAFPSRIRSAAGL